MKLNEVEAIFASHHKPNWGSVSVSESLFIQDCIRRERPQRFVEIGTASGMSCGLIARFMEDADIRGGVVTIDHDDTFFGDKSRPNGFMIPLIYGGSRVTIDSLKFRRSIDLDELDLGPFDMAFVDAAHMHPWPLIDTLFLWDKMVGHRTVIHHDLDLFLKQTEVRGIGPKYLYDQFPSTHRKRGSGSATNIFSVSLDMDVSEFEQIFAHGILLPWTCKLGPKVVHHVRKKIGAIFSESGSEFFEEGLKRFNE